MVFNWISFDNKHAVDFFCNAIIVNKNSIANWASTSGSAPSSAKNKKQKQKKKKTEKKRKMVENPEWSKFIRNYFYH